MTELLLKRELEPAAQQQRRVLVLHRLTKLWFLLAALGVVIAVAEFRLGLPPVLLLLGLGAVGAIAAIAVPSARHTVDYQKLARDIAAQHPDLHALLLTAIEQQPDPQSGRLGFLQERLINEALAEVRRRERIEAVSARRMRGWQALHGLALALFVTALIGMPHTPSAARLALAGKRPVLTVTPGNTNLEHGSGLVVLASFSVIKPGEVTLVINTNGSEARIPLAKNLSDPTFGVSIHEVLAPLTYHVEYSGGRSPEYSVKVFEYPRLERADATLTFPEYTALPPKKIPDTHRVTAVEGSVIDLMLHLNKPVTSARLLAREKRTGSNTSHLSLLTSNLPLAFLSGFRLEKSQSYQLQLVDAEGRTNKIPAQLVFEVLTNQRPQVKLTFPRGDQRVSALQEVLFQAEAQDDFGLQGWGITYSVGGAEARSIPLGGTTPGHVKTNFLHLLRLEDLHVQPDQLVSYFVWADDFGPDGKLRRTSGDLFFSEIRPFEEIFREAEGSQSQAQQQQQQGGNQSPATKLAELQKQIINATWKLQREETAPKPSPGYRQDAPVVRDSQAKALDQLQELDEQLQELKMKDFAEAAAKQMGDALARLNEATDSPAPLPKALAAEQAAYQSLLKLQSREHQVAQAQNQNQSSGSQNAQQRQAQLNQLDLKKQENRYETQREAEQQKPQQNKEQLEVLSRLKELAQRQQDINERLKELQTELQAAKTEREREELRRELKRLRDEQRDMLAGMDELRQKMEQQQPNSADMAQPREQLDQARQQAQRAAEALDQPNVPQALSAGTRAERQLEQTRDDMRKATAGQFTEEMRQMRNDARDLADKQREIQRQMQSATERPKSLTDSGEPQQIAKQLGEQQSAVTNLLDQMKRVTEQAETAEPLLSKELYDSLRRNSKGNLDETLAAAEELTRRNFLREAQPFEQRAAKDIGALKRDVEKAAESVLGDETESLRTARREIDQLAQQLQTEIDRINRIDGMGRGAGSGTNTVAEARPNERGPADTANKTDRAGSGGTNSMAEARPNGLGTNIENPQKNSVNSVKNSADGGGPITGENFAEWSQRLSNVEEMLDRPALRNRLAQVRDRARAARADFKRHSKKPQWDLVNKDILNPLVEVRDRIADELSRRESQDSLAPIDRDPVPGRYGELVRRYYENLGGSRPPTTP